MTKWNLTPRQRCDLEMLAVDGFKPLAGFMTQNDYENVLQNMRLADGQLWPMPITLDVTAAFAATVEPGQQIELRDFDNLVLARMRIDSKWQPDMALEAQQVFGTTDGTHPAVNYLLTQSGTWYLGGPVEILHAPEHYDFKGLRHTPASLKELFQHMGWSKIIGFQTRNPIHRAHMELTLRAARQVDGNLLIHPVVGMTKPGDVDYFTRVRCYQKLLPYYPQGKALLSLLPLAMRMGGPREALWHALIRKNYGCTHFIVGRDHAGPGNDRDGKPFYAPYAAQELVAEHQTEMDVTILPFQEMLYVKERNIYCTVQEVKESETVLNLSGTELRRALTRQETIPAWFSFPEIIKELHQAYPPRHKQGFTLFFTGLSGAGKTTIAQALTAELMSRGRRNISMLDGDEIRRMLTSELGFSKADRDLNIRRIGFVAAQITKVGGIAICAAIAPYEGAREENRAYISQLGGYIEIYISTALNVCEYRDTKGLYAKARRNEMQGMTGIDDPYEAPTQAEIVIDTTTSSVQQSVSSIIHFLEQAGYLEPVLTHTTSELSS
jgi:sulfate adenylyltransferase